MTGFGKGPFGTGKQGFGSWKWSRQVLYDYLPDIYKRFDQDEHDGLLENFSQGERPSFDQLRVKIRDYEALRRPRRVRTQFDEVQTIRLGKQIPVRGLVEQRGVDGVVEVGTGYFAAPSARFRSTDIGKELTLTDSTIEANRVPVRISAIISVNSVATTPSLTTEAGPIRWELRAFTPEVDFAIYEVQSGDVFPITPGWEMRDGFDVLEILRRTQLGTFDTERRLLTEREGVNGSVDANGNFFTTSGAFTQRDVGKKVTVSGSEFDKNNRIIEIAKVVNASTVSPSYTLLRGQTSTGGVVYSGLGFDLGGVTPRISQVAIGFNSSLSVAVDGGDVTVTLATDGVGSPISSASDVAAAVNAHVTASTILFAQADFDGSGGAAPSPFVPVIGDLLQSEVGPLVWAVRPRPELRTKTRAVPKGVVQREGIDLEIVTVTTNTLVRSLTAVFVPEDVGKRLTIRGSVLGNDGTYEIIQVLNLTDVVIAGKLTLENVLGGFAQLFFEVREATTRGDTTQVEVNAPSLIPFLAGDFGITLDLQESEARQRACVEKVSLWIGKKGNKEAYKILGLLSGFDVDTRALFRISQDLFFAIPGDNAFQVAVIGEGLDGTNGSLIAGSPGHVRFTSPTAVFTTANLGDLIFIEDAATLSNNKFYTIETLVSPVDGKATTVEFRSADAATVPDANNLSLTWSTNRLYTDLPPLLPAHDEFNADALICYLMMKHLGAADCIPDPAVAATGTLTSTANVSDGDTVTIDGKAYLYQAVLTNSDGNVQVGGSQAASMENLRRAINLDGVAGTDYATDTTLHPTVSAVDTATTVVVTAKLAGDAGNSIATLETSAVLSWATATLAGGDDEEEFTGLTFTADKFCWEADWNSTMDTEVTVVTPVTPTNSVVTVKIGPFPIANILEIFPNPGTGILPPPIKFTDSSGTEFFLESFPRDTGTGFAQFNILSAQAPVIGAGTLELICGPQDFECDYCAASVAVADIMADTIATESGVAIQDALERVLGRLITEAKPAHVTLLPTFQQTLEATISIRVSGLTNTLTIDPVVLSGDGLLFATGEITQAGAADLLGIGTLSIDPAMTYSASVSMLGSGSLAVKAVVFKP
jgi:hypothetical protein